MDDNFNPDQLIDQINKFHTFTDTSKLIFDQLIQYTLQIVKDLEELPDAENFDSRTLVAAAQQYYVYILKTFGTRELALALTELNRDKFQTFFDIEQDEEI